MCLLAGTGIEAMSLTKDYVRLVGESKATVLKAAEGTKTIIHFAASHGGVENLTLDGPWVEGR